MARKRHRGGRDTSHSQTFNKNRIASEDFFVPLSPPNFVPHLVRSPRIEVEDHRLYHPDKRLPKPVRSSRRWHVPLTLFTPKTGSPRATRSIPHALAFKAPASVNVCVRRNVRREVMFAKGYGGSAPRRRPRRNANSQVRC